MLLFSVRSLFGVWYLHTCPEYTFSQWSCHSDQFCLFMLLMSGN